MYETIDINYHGHFIPHNIMLRSFVNKYGEYQSKLNSRYDQWEEENNSPSLVIGHFLIFLWSALVV